MNKSNYLNQIIFLIKNRNSKIKNLFYLLKYSKFFLNYNKTCIESKKISLNFDKIWRDEIKKDKNLKKNWRQKTNEQDAFNDHYKKYYDFSSIISILNFLSKSKKSIIDIGSYDGFFLQFYKNFSKIFLSDIMNDASIKGHDFIKLNGRDLDKIESNLVDVIFSIDTLVRLDKSVLKNYFENFSRILKPSGILFCHIPSLLSAESYKKRMTMVNDNFFFEILKNDFNEIYFDDNLTKIGKFVIAIKT